MTFYSHLQQPLLGRWKDDGQGGGYYDPNDTGPDQWTPPSTEPQPSAPPGGTLKPGETGNEPDDWYYGPTPTPTPTEPTYPNYPTAAPRPPKPDPYDPNAPEPDEPDPSAPGPASTPSPIPPRTYDPYPGWDPGKLNDPGKRNAKYDFMRAVQELGTVRQESARGNLQPIVQYMIDRMGYDPSKIRVTSDDKIDFGDGYGPVDVLTSGGQWWWQPDSTAGPAPKPGAPPTPGGMIPGHGGPGGAAPPRPGALPRPGTPSGGPGGQQPADWFNNPTRGTRVPGGVSGSLNDAIAFLNRYARSLGRGDLTEAELQEAARFVGYPGNGPVSAEMVNKILGELDRRYPGGQAPAPGPRPTGLPKPKFPGFPGFAPLPGGGPGGFGGGQGSLPLAPGNVNQDPFSALMAQYYGDLIRQLSGPSSMSAKQFEAIRNPIEKGRRTMTSQAMADLADRGLLGTPGHQQGPEATALDRIEQTLGPEFATALAGAATENERTRLGNLNQALQGGAQWQKMTADVALGNLQENRLWNQFMMNFGLDQMKVAEMIRSGQSADLTAMLQLYLQYLGLTGGSTTDTTTDTNTDPTDETTDQFWE